jgi:hypothetical protein
MLGRSTYTMKKDREASVVAGKEIGLEVNAEKTKYIVMYRDQHARRNHNIQKHNTPFEKWINSNI